MSAIFGSKTLQADKSILQRLNARLALIKLQKDVFDIIAPEIENEDDMNEELRLYIPFIETVNIVRQLMVKWKILKVITKYRVRLSKNGSKLFIFIGMLGFNNMIGVSFENRFK